MITEADLVAARWPHRNKLNTITEYQRGLNNPWDYGVEKALVTDSVHLTNDEFADFIQNLLQDRDWLTGKGGTDTTATEGPWRSGVPMHKWTREEMLTFRQGAYRKVVEVIAEDGRFLYIDPQGYNYARYVGFPLEDKPTGAILQKIREPVSVPAASVVEPPAPKKTRSRVKHLMDLIEDDANIEDW